MKVLFVLFAAMLFMGSVAVSVKTSPAFKFADSGAALALGGPQNLPAQDGAGSLSLSSSNSKNINSGSGEVLGASTEAPANANQPPPKVSPRADFIRGWNFSPLASSLAGSAGAGRAEVGGALDGFQNLLKEAPAN